MLFTATSISELIQLHINVLFELGQDEWVSLPMLPDT